MEQSPEQWLASMQQRADDMVRQSQEVQQTLQEMSETAAEPDGAVAVTVSANGALEDLHLDKTALSRGPERLQETILQLAGEAQAKIAGRVVEAVEPVAGKSGLDFLRSQLPADPDAAAAESRRPADDSDDEPPQSFLR
ncbi:YbaB/EbfC family nucleoid-associated protein [Saccharopolyspora rhizosphaerae]|uniref:YbaB/EbfC family nucleoid-associated protein n=1 Tax=Saccharopolyspora rhizosphaerae TaxID=2492662 RepID=UPI001315908E|nr:YbaB/EbfC family nucleoid-associated protein [Saccharopolyspora rhizosphaerae]